MKNLDFGNDFALGFIGDIHGNFQALMDITNPYDNTVFIIAGDCGFGFPDTNVKKIKSLVSKMIMPFLNKRNSYFMFIRGNHDDPAFFQDEAFRSEISTGRFILLPDYSLIKINGKNILCVGGSVSVDRRFRTTGTSYWYGEEMIEPKLMELLNYEGGVDVICAHTANRIWIDHLLPPMPDWLRIAFKEDKKLTPDSERENEICEKLQNYYQPKYWIHGHYHESGKTVINGTEIISLNINELYELK